MNRRQFLQNLSAASAGLLLSGRAQGQTAPVPTPKPSRPNIVLILVDDMGFSDLGCTGSEIETPHLDALCAAGMRMGSFYNAARCCPSRAALLTGLFPHQAGMGHMTPKNWGRPGYIGHLNDSCVTIPDVLRGAGYGTYMAGKWHVGDTRPHWPVDRGFDRYFGTVAGGGNYFHPEPEKRLALDDQLVEPGPDFYMTQDYTDHALRFLDEHRQKRAGDPYFLYMAHYAPHFPLHALPSDIDKYRGKYLKGWDAVRQERYARQVESGLIDKEWPLSPRDPRSKAWNEVENKERWALRMAVYAAQLDCMDRNVGRLISSIEGAGETENTLVIFLSDNGASAEQVDKFPEAQLGTRESYTAYGLPWANASNTPFRRHKSWVHEGGISTPLLARWPGHIEAGARSSQVGHITDLMATCVEVAGAHYPQQLGGREIKPLEGRSLLPVMRGQSRPQRDLGWEHQGNRAFRRGPMKLVAARGETWELYDLEKDRTELNDLARQQPETVAEMSALYDAWAARCNVADWGELRQS